METVTSKDGTKIAYTIGGNGPLLLLVHGMLAERSRWDTLRPALEEKYTVAAMDRRWRGGSGDGPDYSFAREAEDIAAVIDSLGKSVNVLAHSYGSMASMEASKLTDNIATLMLYEPMLGQGPVDLSSAPALKEIEIKALAGDREGALRDFYREFFKASPSEVETLKAAGYWEERKSVIHTCPREGIASRGYRFDPTSVAHIEVPVLLILGSESPPVFEKSAEIVRRAFPNTTSVVMEGQGHHAMATGPDLLTREVLSFLAQQGPACDLPAKLTV